MMAERGRPPLCDARPTQIDPFPSSGTSACIGCSQMSTGQLAMDICVPRQRVWRNKNLPFSRQRLLSSNVAQSTVPRVALQGQASTVDGRFEMKGAQMPASCLPTHRRGRVDLITADGFVKYGIAKIATQDGARQSTRFLRHQATWPSRSSRQQMQPFIK
ncbi:hypothetical protein [Burkholderia sp. RF2-non_BP3]|uniref:hypothetical protein n=1 Tax=Burkholderia sp. RF2-non_BP3 TaxID=1637844 RepID=UPI0012E346E0|nr:hypothetical protein [Burkholderia sp. RF2-non_BP3]